MNNANGIYIAGTDKHAGKTTLSLGLLAHFNQHLPRGAAFLKPIGQKTVMVNGKPVGEDSYLVDRALNLHLSLDWSAPFNTAEGAAEKYIETGQPVDIPERIERAYARLSRRRNLVVVEGSGHPGVGSVFGLSNSRVATLLGTPVLLVLEGGIGSTIDRFALCWSLFQLEKTRLLGVIVNKIQLSKMSKIKAILGAWFEQHGVNVFGYVPYYRPITNPSLAVLGREFDAGPIVLSHAGFDRLVSSYVLASGSVDDVLSRVGDDPGCALVVNINRRDVLDALLVRRLVGVLDHGPEAVVLCDKGEVEPWVVTACQKLALPLFRTTEVPEMLMAKLQHKIFKVEPHESVKIAEIVKLVEEHVDMDGILRALLSQKQVDQPAKPRLFSWLVSGAFRLLHRRVKDKK